MLKFQLGVEGSHRRVEASGCRIQVCGHEVRL